MDTEKNNSDWTEVEIQAAVDAYLSMLSREQAGQAINKAHENRVLREGALAGRTKSSVEFRMQNISTVLDELKRDRIKGYKPAKNVGPRVTKIIREALNAPGPITPEDLVPTADEATLEQRALKLERRPIEFEPKGIEKPQQTQSSGKSFVRDPGVRAWVRQQAKGLCEGCGEPAPFEKSGQPFLEVHHVKPLSVGGTDTVDNTQALCPNCHRESHFG